MPLKVLAKGTQAGGGVKDAAEVFSLGGRETDSTDRNRGCIMELVPGNEQDKFRFDHEVTTGQSEELS